MPNELPRTLYLKGFVLMGRPTPNNHCIWTKTCKRTLRRRSMNSQRKVENFYHKSVENEARIWDLTTPSCITNSHQASVPSKGFKHTTKALKMAHNIQKCLRVSRLGFRTTVAGNEANIWGLSCLNRVQNPEIWVSQTTSNSSSWSSKTRTNNTSNMSNFFTQTRWVGL